MSVFFLHVCLVCHVCAVLEETKTLSPVEEQIVPLTAELSPQPPSFFLGGEGRYNGSHVAQADLELTL